MPDIGQKRKRSNRAFSSRQASRLGRGGGEVRQAGSPEQRKEEVNKRVLKELLPFIALKTKKNLFAAFWVSIFYHLIAKLGLTMLV